MTDRSRRSADTQWERGPDVLWRRTFDRVVVLVPSTGQPLQLSSNGAAAWDLLDGDRTVLELSHELAAAYGTTAEAVCRDLSAFFEQLCDLGVLVRA